MSAGSETQPVVVYIDDDARGCAAFERAFQGEHRIVTGPVSALRDIRRPAVLVFDAATVASVGEELFAELAEQHPLATRLVVTKPWQQDGLVPLLAASCAAWTHATARVRSLTHDLRTPLMALLSDAEHLGILAESAPTLHEPLSLLANDMQRAARQLQQLVERLEI